MSHSQEHFEYIIKRHETATDNPSIMTYINEIEIGNRLRLK